MIRNLGANVFCLLGLFGGCALLAAQPEFTDPAPSAPLPSPTVPRVDELPVEPPVEEREYWEETVERALEKATSENPEIRRSAVMLLGKYPVPQAEEAVVAALEDTDAGVRQAALVSLFERRRLYRGNTAVKIAERVGDSDVGIRRIASNVLPMVMHGFPLRMSPEQRRPARDLPEGLHGILVDAFRDEDATVRRNMIGHYSQLHISIPATLMADLLRDSDREVAIEALHVVVRHFGPDFLAGEAPDLVTHPDRVYRLVLARQLADANRAGAVRALAELRGDEDVEVSLEAEVAYFRQVPETEVYRELIERFDRATGQTEIARRAVRAVTLLDDEGEPFLRHWMEHSSPSLRQDAVQIFFARFPGAVVEEDLIGLLDDENRPLRDAALRFLRRHPARISLPLLQVAAGSPYAEVRRSAVPFTRYVAEASGEEILEELLLDEDSQVRAEVLGEMAARRTEGWERILTLSLRDNDPGIREAALQGLVNEVTPGTLEALRGFLERHPDSSLRPVIEEHLARYDREAPSGSERGSEL